MLFDPRESIDFNGNTGPFIQYTHARICSVLRKADEAGIDHATVDPNVELLRRRSSSSSRSTNSPPSSGRRATPTRLR